MCKSQLAVVVPLWIAGYLLFGHLWKFKMKIAKPRNFSDIIIGLSSAKMLSSNLRIIFAIIQGCAIIHFYSRCLETICWYKTPTSTSGRVLPPANCWLTNWCIYLSRDYKMFVKISVLIESGDWVLRTGLSGAGAGGEHLHPDFSLSVSAAPQLAGLQEERWLD